MQDINAIIHATSIRYHANPGPREIVAPLTVVLYQKPLSFKPKVVKPNVKAVVKEAGL
jgi:hypothetical protein